MFFGAHHLIPSHETHHIASDNGDDNEHDNDENDENDQDDKDDRLLLVDHVTGIESTRTRTRPFAALIPASAAATNDKRYSDDQEAALKFPTNSTPTTPRFVPDQQLTDRTEYTSQKTFPRSHKYSSSFTVSYAHPGRPLVSSSTPPLQDHLNGRYTLTNGVESQVQDDDEVERAPFPVTSISQTDPHYGYTTSNATVLRRGGKASISATTTPLSQRSSMPSAAYSQYRQPQSDLAYSTFPSQGPATSSIMQSSLIGGTPMAPAPSSASNIGVGPGSGLSLTNGQGIGGYSGMPGQTANSANSSNGLVYPALHLHPLNDTFAPKQISLTPPGPQNRVKIGRQTNAKTIPHPNNGYFDSKVLSRMHAEVWSQEGKVSFPACGYERVQVQGWRHGLD